MVNLKDDVIAALDTITDKASDSWPQSEEEMEGVVYTEEENKSYERSGKKTTKSYCRFRIDIFSQGTTTPMAQAVDRVLGYDPETESGMGMTRTMCTDDNNGNLRHKIMRYECIVGESDRRIYGIN